MLWTILLAAALLWPGRALSAFDGMPLDRPAEAIAIGVVVPALWWARRGFLEGALARALIVGLLAVKCAGALLLTQHGLCARFTTAAPFHAEVLTIPVDEPRGFLRSWDVRADWRSATPACTAVVGRPYPTASSFPAWFLNITDAAAPGTRSVMLDVNGFARVRTAGRFSLDLGRDMVVTGEIGGQAVRSADGATVAVPLAAGVHAIDLHARLTGDRWALVPRWNGFDAFTQTTLTVAQPGTADRLLAAPIALATAALVAALIVSWLWSFFAAQRTSPSALAWCAVATLLLATAGATGRFERFAALLLFAGALVPVAAPQRNLRGAFLLLGVPWLALFAARALPLVGHFSAYSSDDWLAYQVAGYRIVMNGFWLQGGSPLFDYQPLYRWITGLLHLAFGDSSVGETYSDAACLLVGGLLAFQIGRSVAGFRAGLLAGAATLSTFTLGTIWYFVGRGLSETAASGFLFLAAFFMLRARLGGVTPAVVAGVMATLMFYARLNHLLFALCLPVLVWPLRTPASLGDWRRAASVVRTKAALIYGVVLSAGLVAFAARTWWYSGVFSIFFGTSLKNNDTGLRLTTIGSPEVWRRIGHSLWALIWMNEPARPDARAVFVASGVALAALALTQVPRVSRLPASVALACVAAMLSALFVHTHNYPGRMTIHLVPFTAALAVIATTRAFVALSNGGGAARARAGATAV